MSLAVELQPDQKPERWDDHVAVYEEVFEPLTNAFASRALDQLDAGPGARLLDIGAGAGGAALIAAARGADVVAIDASPRMAARIVSRASDAGLAGRVHADVMDGMALALPDASFDAAISVFGVILFPDTDRGMREIARVLKPGGRAAVVAWPGTELRARDAAHGRDHRGTRAAASPDLVAGTVALSRRRGAAQVARRCRPDGRRDRARRGALAHPICALDCRPHRIRAGNGGHGRRARPRPRARARCLRRGARTRPRQWRGRAVRRRPHWHCAKAFGAT